MMATLTVVTLTQDDTGAEVDPVADAVAIANDANGDKFYNGTDRRTILIVHNGAATDHAPLFWTKRYFGGDDQGAWTGALAGRRDAASPPSTSTSFYSFGSLITAGTTKVFGPFPSYWFNDGDGLVQFTMSEQTTNSQTNGSGITVLPVYVPNVDGVANITYRQQS